MSDNLANKNKKHVTYKLYIYEIYIIIKYWCSILFHYFCL